MSNAPFDNAIRWRPGERLHHLFEARCDDLISRGEGDHPAIIWEDEIITYQALDARANQLARYLRRQGVQPGDRVGILLERSVNTYVALLAALKAHAAYAPLDPSFPQERVAFIAGDADLKYIITTSDFRAHLEVESPLICLDEVDDRVRAEDKARLTADELGQTEDQLCYIIYTSGSTGRPKGVAIEHPSICNFVRVAGEVYDVREEDRVYQGMSISFDFSVEEIWAPLVAGATLVPAPGDMKLLGDELESFLRRHEITVFCTVPTLLATIEHDLPLLRLLIVGGEACPAELVRRWHRPGRRILNTYGPTETTVTATWAELHPHKPVTIGRPMPTYAVALLGEDLKPVAQGEAGEICIAGIGLARGYVNRDDLTEKYFIPDFLQLPNNPSGRLYRTGDLGRINEEGEIEFLGRIDTQVKIRGYRIELSEIESVLMRVPEIDQAVVSTFAATPDASPELVAYCTLKRGIESLPPSVLNTLRAYLPAYMIPAYIEVLPELPLLPSGKVDRKKLPRPRGPRFVAAQDAYEPPTTEMERVIADAIARAFNLERVSVTGDFFTDLGGHSLAVASAASLLRKEAGLSDIALGDFYRYPTVRKLAAFVQEKQSEIPADASVSPPLMADVYRASDRKVWLAGLVQAIFLFIYAGVSALPLVWLLNWSVQRPAWNPTEIALLVGNSALMTLGIFALLLIWPILLRWLLLPSRPEGEYNLWGWFFLRWWMVNKATMLAPLALLKGTPLLNLFYRLMGASIGRGVLIETHFLHAPYLITLGDAVSIGPSTQLFAYEVQNGYLQLRRVTIGQRCYIGSNSVVMPGARMEDGSLLGDQSLLPAEVVIPVGESWVGSPASNNTRLNRRILHLKTLYETSWKKPKTAPGFFTTLGLALAVLFVLFVPFLATMSAAEVMILAYEWWGRAYYMLSAPVAGLTFVLVLSITIILAKRLVLPEIDEGLYEVDSLLYIRKWIADALMEISLGMTNALYSTLYLPMFLRRMGAKIGRLAEISTISHITPSLLTIEDESFLADIAHVGPSYAYLGILGVKPVTIGRRSFVGNAAFVPGGVSIADGCLMGVLSMPATETLPQGSSWLGSPAFYLPKRQVNQDFDDSLTYSPPCDLYLKRLGYEFFRIILPPTLLAMVGGFHVMSIALVLERFGLLVAAVLSPVLFLLAGLVVTAIVSIIKDSLVGQYQPRIEPLWNIFVRRTELVTALYESAVVPILLSFLTGTPFLAPIWRLLGVKVGKRCFIETTFLTEFDLVEIGDDASIGFMCSLQTHLFEDRVMKMSYVRIGDGCTIGPRAVVLYDSLLEADVQLDALSLVMKGETLPAHTRWQGSPSKRIVIGGNHDRLSLKPEMAQRVLDAPQHPHLVPVPLSGPAIGDYAGRGYSASDRSRHPAYL